MKLPDETFQTIQAKFAAQHYPEGSVIFQEGEPGNEMYIVLDGRLRVTLQGEELVFLSNGDLFGEVALVSDIPRSGTVTAVSDCRLIPISKQQFGRLIKELDQFALQVMSVMAVRMNHWMEEEVKHKLLAHELAIASRIQISLLPQETPTIPGWQIADFYCAARQVGGDFFDYIQTPNKPGSLGIVIADVSGKGVPAALFMAMARTMIRAESRNCGTSAETLTRTNSLILSDSRAPLFLSALHASLDTDSALLTYASAGHEQPLICHKAGGMVDDLPPGGLVLGAFSDVTYGEQQVSLQAGDVVLFYTDGISESRNDRGQFFGEDRLQAVFQANRQQSAVQIRDAIIDAVTTFSGAHPQDDDLTLIVIKRDET